MGRRGRCASPSDATACSRRPASSLFSTAPRSLSSPSGKPFSYGHPSVERFFGGSADAAPATPPRHPLSALLVQALGRQEKELRDRLEAGRRRKAALEEALRGPQWGPVGDLLGADVEELGLPELDLLQSALEWVRAEAVSRARQLAVEALPAPTGEASGEGFAFSSAPPELSSKHIAPGISCPLPTPSASEICISEYIHKEHANVATIMGLQKDDQRDCNIICSEVVEDSPVSDSVVRIQCGKSKPQDPDGYFNGTEQISNFYEIRHQNS
ncbi:hypothetical protein ZIOFF_059286 [Zingiber officinale]|uniref:Uncharacterized protein n=1 Tax=Zingiber officinale TaxID=94328 RepID=A0A8J5F4Q0_ZINOF|nr:hypothetical protein ZIOFF_059286 [Zingiber officinale]